MSRIPAPALLLGIAGLIPFIWAALLILGLSGGQEVNLPPVLSGDGRLILIRYGGIILPFMSGVLWGFATKASGGRAVAAYALSVLPALWWFFMPGTGVTSGLSNLATGFLAVLILDFFFQRWALTPAWWLTLRIQLTVIVLICLAIGIWA